MDKSVINRIYLKDTENNLYRICSFSNWRDKYGEFYLKVMFPDLKNIPLLTGLHDRGVVEPGERLPEGIQEFTFHYRSGVSHFKNSSKSVDPKRDLPTLIDSPALSLFRFIIRSTHIFKIQKQSKISNNDFILPVNFEGYPRGFEFAISRVSGPWNIINEAGDEPVLSYKIPLDDKNTFLHIADSKWTRPPMVAGKPPFEIFRYENPTSQFEFKKF